jgi:hypothetical protein
MLNIHSRELRAPIEAVQPWIERSWSGGDQDIFPRDVVRSWRKNPPELAKDALVPGVTRVGHGPFRFRFQEWDGRRWRVTVEKTGYLGWHGFDLEPSAAGCRITHTIDLQLTGLARLAWPLVFASLHDWIVESMFDRLEAALRSGAVPSKSSRPPTFSQSSRLSLLRRFS